VLNQARVTVQPHPTPITQNQSSQTPMTNHPQTQPPNPQFLLARIEGRPEQLSLIPVGLIASMTQSPARIYGGSGFLRLSVQHSGPIPSHRYPSTNLFCPLTTSSPPLTPSRLHLHNIHSTIAAPKEEKTETKVTIAIMAKKNRTHRLRHAQSR